MSNKEFSFEREVINGKPNPKYVDVLDEDKPIAGQKFVCMSFISPEKILKEKNMYFFEKFLKDWDIFKSMEKFPAPELMEPLIEDIKAAIKNDDHEKLIRLYKNNVEGYENESK